MNDEFQPPVPSPEDDRELDTSLAELARFKPRPGFTDRILARVFVPLPRWARSVRDRLRGLVSGPRGWVILGTFSVATAATWAVVIGVTVDQWDRLTVAARIAARSVGMTDWQDAVAASVPVLEATRDGVAGAVGAIPMPIEALVAGYGILTLACVVALRRLTRIPASMRVAR